MNTIFILILILILFYYINIFILNEHFLVTWTPYSIDKYNQPGYSNYFYHNNYMYPVF
jgi:hypothetical protein